MLGRGTQGPNVQLSYLHESEEMGIHFPTAEWKNTESKSADIARPSYRYRALSIDKDIELRMFQIADPDSVLLVFACFQFLGVTANGQQFLVSVPPRIRMPRLRRRLKLVRTNKP